MESDYKIFWSDEAIDNLASILDYLKLRWTEREISRFKHQLNKHLNLIKANPFAFPKSSYNLRLRKAVISKQTTIYYEVEERNIYLVYLFNSRQDIIKIR